MSEDRVRVRMRKWADDPHWEFDAVPLGSDEHGRWIGVAAGTWLSRPGAGFAAQCDQVVLLPIEQWWAATFYGDDPERPVDLYVDMATPAEWTELDGVAQARCVDLDLDVIRGTRGRVWVDDEDEFAEHRVSKAYPEDVVRHAEQSCAWVLAAVNAGQAPFDFVAARTWLDRFRRTPNVLRTQ